MQPSIKSFFLCNDISSVQNGSSSFDPVGASGSSPVFTAVASPEMKVASRMPLESSLLGRKSGLDPTKTKPSTSLGSKQSVRPRKPHIKTSHLCCSCPIKFLYFSKTANMDR